MVNPLKNPAAANFGLFCAPAPLGAYFAIAGYHKITGKGGVSGFVQNSRNIFPAFTQTGLGTVFLSLLPFTELAVGTMLFLGLFTRIAGLLAILLLASFMIAVTGVAGTNELPFQPNVIFVGCALLALLAGGGDVSIDRVAYGPPAGPRR